MTFLPDIPYQTTTCQMKHGVYMLEMSGDGAVSLLDTLPL